ncbi:hypothetical protein GW796_10440 [archaeon]|nr:hypothetical protein [archaeon]
MKKITIMFISLLFSINSAHSESNLSVKLNTLNILHSFKNNSNNNKALLKFKILIEAKFPKEIQVNLVNSNNTLPSEKYSEFESLELGVSDIILPKISEVQNYYQINNFEFLNSPYLFNDKTLDIFINSPEATEFLNTLTLKTEFVQPITIWPDEYNLFFVNKKITKLDDLKNLNIITNNFTNNNFLNSIGIQAKIIDLSNKNKNIIPEIIESSTENALDKNIYKEYKNIVITNKNRDNHIVLTNKKRFSVLPKNIQSEIVLLFKRIATSNITFFNEAQSKNIESLRSKYQLNTYELNKDEINFLKEKSNSLTEQYLQKENNTILNKTNNLLKKN